ncbi:MAG: DUF3857 domain-containing protein [Myxococcota bacterium]|jgi:transglutaminase-like putative cysteine protease|nr:DUF3857 domain-containing protein [Myxococcota bacterium]
MNRPSLLLVAVVAVFSACTSSHWPAIDRSTLPSKESADHEAVLLFDRTEVRLLPEPSSGKAVADTRAHVQVYVNTAAGIDRWGRIHLTLADSYMELLSFQARVLTPDGSETCYDAEDLKPHHQYLELYSDTKRLFVDLPTVVPGSVVEWEYVIRKHDLRILGVTHYFGDWVPVRESSLTVRFPKNWEVAWDADPSLEPPSESELRGERVLRFHARELPAHKLERYQGGAARLPRVYARLSHWTEDGKAVEGLATWAQLSAYWYPRYLGQSQADDAIRAQVDSLLAGANDRMDRVRRLYDWVRDEIEYVALEFGEGRWLPHQAAQIFAVGYGDCKDKATLLAAMLRHAGIESRPVLVYAHAGISPTASPVQGTMAFNHAILSIDTEDGPLFMDPTSKASPLGELPVMDQGASALRLSEDGEQLIVLPQSTAEENQQRLYANLRISKDGTVSGDFVLRLSGVPAHNTRARLRRVAPGAPQEDAVRFQTNVVERELSALTVEGLDDPYVPLVLRGKLVLSYLSLQQSGEGHASGSSFRSLSAYDLLIDSQPVWPEAERHNDIALGPPISASETLVIALDDAFQPIDAYDFQSQTDFASYRLSYSNLDAERAAELSEELEQLPHDALVLERQWQRKLSVLEAEHYESLKSYGSLVRSVELSPVLLRSAATKEQAATNEGEKGQ